MPRLRLPEYPEVCWQQIEKGEVNPTISVLWKIANGYKVSFTCLVEDRAAAVSVIRQQDMTPQSEDDGRYLNYPIFPFSETTLFETYRIVVQPGGKLSAQPHLKGCREFITVFVGAVEIVVSNDRYRLEKGDSTVLRGCSSRLLESGAEAAELSMLIYYNK